LITIETLKNKSIKLNHGSDLEKIYTSRTFKAFWVSGEWEQDRELGMDFYINKI
jgi:hypothetical protein